MRLLDRFRLTHRVWTVVVVYWLVFLLAMAAGIFGMRTARDALHHVHNERMQVVEALAVINRNFYENRLQILLAFQHDPDGPLSSDSRPQHRPAFQRAASHRRGQR